MKFKRHVELEHGLKQVDIAPLIDIVFQLLIFFMLTSSFVSLPGINVNLPEAQSSSLLERHSIVLVVSAENVIYFDGVVTTLAELEKRLQKKGGAQLPVLLQADSRASMGRVVEVWDACRKLGFSKVNIATTHKK
jgi:biopolymer transport protein ExbD